MRSIEITELPPPLILDDLSTKIVKSHEIKTWLKRWIKDGIKSKEFKAGDKLPTCPRIAKYLGTSHSIVYFSFRLLNQENIIQLRFYDSVIADKKLQEIKPITQLDQIVYCLKKYIIENCEVDEFLPALNQLAEKLELHPDRVWRAERILYEQGILDKQTKGRMKDNLPQWRVQRIPQLEGLEPEKKLLFETLENKLIELVKSLPKGSRIPTQEVLANKYKTSTVLIRKVFKDLLDKKLICVERSRYYIGASINSFEEETQERLLQMIKGLKDGEYLPGIRTLSKKFKIGECALYSILQQFQEQGLVKVSNNGYFVGERPLTLKNQITDVLRQRVKSMRSNEAFPLIQDLADEYNTHNTVIRTAFKKLIAEGKVYYQPRRYYAV